MATSYVTAAEADTYVASHYISSDAARTRWEALSDGDKNVYLLQSVEALNQLPFHGKPYDITQENAFPRYPYDTVPNEVKYAQIENAVKLSDATSADDSVLYEKLMLYGIKSYSIGNLSETLGGVGTVYPGVVSFKALKLLQKYLTGGYRIR